MAPARGLAPDHPLPIGPGMEQDGLRLHHFDRPEEDFAWSMGRFAEVEFECAAAAPASLLLLLLDLDVFRMPPLLLGQNVLIYLNGLRVHSTLVTERSTVVIRLRPGVLEAGPNRLTFDLPDAIRPTEFGMEDGRMLGLKLFSLTLETEAS